MLPSEYMELKHIDKLLQCGICYEYMDTSVITSCSHNYCSLCIRKYLHYKTQCPICFEETFEKDLRTNKLLDEIIIHYLNFKEKLEKKFYQKDVLTVENKNCEILYSSSNFECKKEQNVPDTNKILDKSFDSPTSMASNTTPRGQKEYQNNVSTPSTSTEFRIPSIFTPKRKGIQNEETYQPVTCPVCKVDVPQNNINKHLDDCLKRENIKDQPKKSEPKRKPLPKLVLSLMKDNVIKKRLKELGLSSQGDRKALESRLQRYIILYNAECDKINPRPVSELIKQCEEEENLEKKVQKPSNRLNVNRNTEHNVIEQQRKKYLTVNKNSFDQLIMNMKSPNKLRKLSVRRNILSKENTDVPYEDCITESISTIRDNEKSSVLALNSYIEDSHSNASCSNINPIDFLTMELSTSSNDSNDQYASNYVSNYSCKTKSVLSDSIVTIENAKSEELLFPEKIIIHEEITFNNQSKECNASENGMDVDSKESVPQFRTESENERTTKLKRSQYSRMNSHEKRDAYAKSKDLWKMWKKKRNEEINSVEDIEYVIGDSDDSDIQDYERSKHEQLHNVKESASNQKENLKSSNENIKSCTLQKQDHEMAFTLSDKEKIADRSMNTRKSPMFGLSEARGFNNENCEDKMQDEEKLQNEKEPQHVTRSYMRRHLKSKIISDKKINNRS